MRELTERIEIAAPAQQVWEVLADFGGVSDWAPYMTTSHLVGEARTGIGARRAMRHAWGFRFEEIITDWIDDHGYSFDVHKAPYPMKEVKESWRLTRENGVSMVLTRVTYGMKLGFLGFAIDWLLVRFIVKREMRAGLRGLKQHLEN